MVKCVLTRKAVDDLSNVWNYTFEVWSESQADKYYLLLMDGLDQVARQPEKGKRYELVKVGLRGIRVAKHIIFYFTTAEGVEVVRILHEQMDLQQRNFD